MREEMERARYKLPPGENSRISGTRFRNSPLRLRHPSPTSNAPGANAVARVTNWRSVPPLSNVLTMRKRPGRADRAVSSVTKRSRLAARNPCPQARARISNDPPHEPRGNSDATIRTPVKARLLLLDHELRENVRRERLESPLV